MLLLPQWPPFSKEKPHPVFVAAAKVFNAFRSFGEGNPFAIAMVTMAFMESWFLPEAVGDNGTAFGVFQWHTDRAARIKTNTGIDLLAKPPPGLADQCRAAYWELNATETKARNAMRAAKTAYDAAAAATALYERAGAASAVERRAAEAEKWSAFIAANLAWVVAQDV